jgi:hypothetical protein
LKVKYKERLKDVMSGMVTDLEINSLVMDGMFFTFAEYCCVLTQSSMHLFSSINISMSFKRL